MKYVLVVLVFLAVILSGIVVLGARNQNSSNPSSSSSIVTSFYPLYFFTKEIVGEYIPVTIITPAGSEPHDYEPTAQQIASMEKSDLIVIQGGTFESWGENIRQTYTQKVVVAGEHNAADPHIWLDPTMAAAEVQRISTAIIAFDPSHRTEYEQRTQRLFTQLSELQMEYQKGLTTCQRRDFITSHAAFGYVAKAFALNQLSISGISPDNEPTARDMANLVKFARDHDIHFIFFERLVSPKLAQTIASEVGAETLVLDPIEGIPEQQMKEGVNYFTIMKENLRALQTALQCQT